MSTQPSSRNPGSSLTRIRLALGGTAAALLAALVLAYAGWPAQPELLRPGADAQPSAEQVKSEALVPGRWNIVYHGTCCEGNLAAAGPNAYVLLPVLVNGNKIERSSDGGKTWQRTYPLADASVPFGIEGDLVAFGEDAIYFGTELGAAAVAMSSDAGATWTLVQVPIAPVVNDQAWAYLGAVQGNCPAPLTQSKPYMLAGWFRIGAEIIFSCDGGLTWPLHTLSSTTVEANGAVVCSSGAKAPADGGDTRVADPDFAFQKAGRHGAWGTDGKFYWTETAAGKLYVCNTANFGQSWQGTAHSILPGKGKNYTVTQAGFDDKGTLYVLHGDKMHVSFDGGSSFRYVHKLPRYGNAGRSDSGADQYFAFGAGKVHFAVNQSKSFGGSDPSNIWYLAAEGLDTDAPVWHEELVDVTDFVRLDFMQIVVTGNGIPVISYTTPAVPSDATALREVTTATLNPEVPLPAPRAEEAQLSKASGSGLLLGGLSWLALVPLLGFAGLRARGRPWGCKSG